MLLRGCFKQLCKHFHFNHENETIGRSPRFGFERVGSNAISNEIDGVIMCQLCDDEAEEPIESNVTTDFAACVFKSTWNHLWVPVISWSVQFAILVFRLI